MMLLPSFCYKPVTLRSKTFQTSESEYEKKWCHHLYMMKIKNTECFLFNQIHSLVALKMCRLCKETKKLFRKISNLLNKRWNYLEKKDASTLALLSIFHKAVIVFLLKPKSGYSTLPSSWEGARSLSVFSPSQPLLPVSPITHPANHPVFSLVPLTPSHFKTLLFLPPDTHTAPTTASFRPQRRLPNLLYARYWLGQNIHLGFPIRWYRKAWTNFLANPIPVSSLLPC